MLNKKEDFFETDCLENIWERFQEYCQEPAKELDKYIGKSYNGVRWNHLEEDQN